jgi:hypothetical protein
MTDGFRTAAHRLESGLVRLARGDTSALSKRQRMNESLGTDQLQASRLTTIGLPDIRRSQWPKRLALTGLILISECSRSVVLKNRLSE